MTSNFKWAVLVFAIASFGLWACGDSKGGGSSENICDEKSTSYDEQACEECQSKLDACLERDICESEGWAASLCGWSKCEREIDAYETCQDTAWEKCDKIDDHDAYVACRENACAREDAVVNDCGRARCGVEINNIQMCWDRECPGTSACMSFLD